MSGTIVLNKSDERNKYIKNQRRRFHQSGWSAKESHQSQEENSTRTTSYRGSSLVLCQWKKVVLKWSESTWMTRGTNSSSLYVPAACRVGVQDTWAAWRLVDDKHNNINWTMQYLLDIYNMVKRPTRLLKTIVKHLTMDLVALLVVVLDYWWAAQRLDI